MEDARRQILTLVARGELDPGEAADRLAELDAPPGAAAPGSAMPGGPVAGTGPTWSWPDHDRQVADGPSEDSPTEDGPPVDGATTAPVTRIRVDASVRAVVIVGDPEVVGAIADGPHSAQWEGDTLFIGEEHGAETFQFDWSELALRRRGRDVLRARALHIRMHPSLALDAVVSAGSLTVRRVHGPITATVAAGSAKIDDFEGPISLAVSAGSVSARGRLTSGESRIDCDAGSVSLLLTRGSSVSIRARSDLGKVSLPGSHSSDGRSWLLGGTSEATVGTGQANLDIRVNMGGVSVNVDNGA